MDFTAVTLACPLEATEALMAELAELGFTTMETTSGGFVAYIDATDFDDSALQALHSRYLETFPFEYSVKTIARENWNKDWESNFSPITVGSKCLVRATFHSPDPSFPFEIIINPKMSFGTGHHQTTYLMIKNIIELALDIVDKEILDVGCGTGILGILCIKMGAKKVTSCDIDDWAIENARENYESNAILGPSIIKGKIAAIDPGISVDVLLANINRNVLIEEISSYSGKLVPGGKMLLSGFYAGDIHDIENAAIGAGLQVTTRDNMDDWACLLLEKITESERT